MRNIIAIPLLGLAVIIQSALVTRISLLGGFADIVIVILAAWALQEGVTTSFHWALLAGIMISIVSRLPWFVFLPAYAGTVMMAQLLQRRVWQVPLMAMFSVTFIGTVFLHCLSLAYLFFSGEPIYFSESLGFITLPSVLLNMLIAIPMYSMMHDLAGWVFPQLEAR